MCARARGCLCGVHVCTSVSACCVCVHVCICTCLCVHVSVRVVAATSKVLGKTTSPFGPRAGLCLDEWLCGGNVFLTPSPLPSLSHVSTARRHTCPCAWQWREGPGHQICSVHCAVGRGAGTSAMCFWEGEEDPHRRVCASGCRREMETPPTGSSCQHCSRPSSPSEARCPSGSHPEAQRALASGAVRKGGVRLPWARPLHSTDLPQCHSSWLLEAPGVAAMALHSSAPWPVGAAGSKPGWPVPPSR